MFLRADMLWITACLITVGSGAAIPVQAAPPVRSPPTVSRPVSNEDARYLDGAIATVNNRPITRRELILALTALEPRLIGAYALVRKPRLDDVLTVSLADLCRKALAGNMYALEPLVQDLMLMRAMEDAARAHSMMVTEAEMQQRLHLELQTRRQGVEISSAGDADLADRLGETLPNLRRAVHRRLLIEHLVQADLNRRLGHAVSSDDFFSAHMLYIAGNKEGLQATPAELEAAKARVEQLRQQILHNEITFEVAAAHNSNDTTQATQGNLGAMPRTLIKKELETALLKQPVGGITMPIPLNNGYAIARLDRLGKDISAEERTKALRLCMNYKKRQDEALANMLHNVQWFNSLGQPPLLNTALTNHP